MDGQWQDGTMVVQHLASSRAPIMNARRGHRRHAHFRQPWIVVDVPGYKPLGIECCMEPMSVRSSPYLCLYFSQWILKNVHTAKLRPSPKMDNIWQTHSANSPSSTVGARYEPLLWRFGCFLVRAITWSRPSRLLDRTIIDHRPSAWMVRSYPKPHDAANIQGEQCFCILYCRAYILEHNLSHYSSWICLNCIQHQRDS